MMLRAKLRHAVAFLLLAVLCTGVLLVSAPPSARAQGVENLDERADLQRKQRVQDAAEALRLLYSQGRYEDVIMKADELLELDPENLTAKLQKELAESRLTAAPTGGTSDPSAPLATPAAVEGAVPQVPRKTGDEGLGVIEAAPYVPPPPAPLAPRRTNVAWRGLTQWLLLAGLAILLIALFVVVIMLIRGRRKQVQPAPASKAASPMMGSFVYTPPTSTGTGFISDKATEHQAKTGFGADPGTSTKADPGTGVAADPGTGVAHDPGTGVAPDPGTGVVLDAPTVPDKQTSFDSLALSGIVVEEPKKAESYSGMNIDYSDTDSPLASSQSPDVQQTGPGAFGAAAPEPVAASPARRQSAPTPIMDIVSADLPPAKAPAKGAPEPDKATEISLEETLQNVPAVAPSPIADKPTSIDLGLNLALPAPPPMPEKRPAAAAPPPAIDIAAAPVPPPPDATMDPNALSFNSLMFGADSTKGVAPPPAAAASKPAGGDKDEELTLNSFNNEFSNVMFGAGAEETKVPGAKPPAIAKGPAAAPAASGSEVTKLVSPIRTPAPGPASPEAPTRKLTPPPAVAADPVDPDRTAPLPAVPAPAATPAAAAGGEQKVSLFDRQRDAGKAAFEAADYAKAVQCLSVAASLRPGDKEVREMLEEARKRRRA